MVHIRNCLLLFAICAFSYVVANTIDAAKCKEYCPKSTVSAEVHVVPNADKTELIVTCQCNGENGDILCTMSSFVHNRNSSAIAGDHSAALPINATVIDGAPMNVTTNGTANATTHATAHGAVNVKGGQHGKPASSSGGGFFSELYNMIFG